MKITRIKTNVTRGRKPLVMVYPEELDKLEALAIDDWISVEDNPPEMDKNYIVSDGKEFVGEMKYSSNKYSKKPKPRFEWQGRVNFPWEIKYYKPLPTSPKGE